MLLVPVEGRDHLKPAGLDGVIAVGGGQLVFDIENKMRRAYCFALGHDAFQNVDLFGGLGLVFGNVVLLGHEVEDQLPAVNERVGMRSVRRVVGGALRNGGEQRRFGEVKVLGVFAEERLRRCLDPVGGRTVRDFVEIHF